jgi:hypothetical protein
VGELLFKISGIVSKVETEQPDEAPEISDSSRRTLAEVLGTERRNRILSALYLVRQDGVNVVRHCSIDIWKALVQNTPRTGNPNQITTSEAAYRSILVREILPELINQIIFLISGMSMSNKR